MAKIHVSSYIKEPLTLETDMLPQQLEACAKELQAIARQYKKVANFIKEKQIKILNTDGDAHCGFFEVDEIDTGRLVSQKMITDNNKEEKDNHSAFFIDSKLDGYLENIAENPEFKAKVLSEIMDEEDELPSKEEMSDMSFNEETKDFIFKCSSCEEIHSQDLEGVYSSLQMAKLMLQGLAETRESEEDPVADEAEDAISGLGFLQFLLESKYGCGKCDDCSDKEEEKD